MKVENNRKKSVIKFLNGKAFYVVLCMCFVALGLAGWAGFEGMKQLESGKNNSQISSQISDGTKTESKPIDTAQKDTDTDADTDADLDQSKVESSYDSDDTESDNSDSKQEQSTQTAAPVATYFVNPVLGEVIKGFSSTELQYSMTMKDMRLHKGVDIAADSGTPVIAAGEGVVTDVSKDAMLGTVVTIDHGNGIVVKYCGLNALPSVKKGDVVDSSKQLGTVDVIPCESVEQRHLHLEFYKDGVAVSPLDYIMY